MIDDFSKKKLVDYLKPKQKVLIRFGHGWGDTLMFMPVFEELKKKYHKVHFALYLENGQEEIFKSEPDKDGKDYDLVFSLNFPMSEGSEMTKAEKCCREEIGINPVNIFTQPVAQLPSYDSPFVAVHFQGTSLPGSVNCPEVTAEQIWKEIEEAGKIPIECHFEHLFHNPVNKKYKFVNRDVRGISPDLKKLIGLIQHCFAFVGIASGPLVTAMSVMPDRTLYLEKHHKIKNYSRQKIDTVDIMLYQEGQVKQWLQNMQQ